MFQSVRRYLTGPEPVVCYQGAVVADPATRRVPAARADPARPGPRGRSPQSRTAGHGLNCYVDDELYVARVTPEAERYATFQHIELHVVGPLLEWLERPPTKLVVVGEPHELDALGAQLRAHFDGTPLHREVAAVLPRVRAPGRVEGRGPAVRRGPARLHAATTVAFGDGENDIELVDWAGFAVAVDNAHPAVKARAGLRLSVRGGRRRRAGD